MVSSIFQEISSAVTGMLGTLGDGITEATKLIYDPTANSNAGALTTFGVLCLIGVGVAVCYTVFRWIRNLIHLRG